MKPIFSIWLLVMSSALKAGDIDIVADIESSFGHRAMVAEYRTSKGINKTSISISFANYVCIKDVAVIDTSYEDIKVKWSTESNLRLEVPHGITLKNLVPEGFLSCGEQKISIEVVVG